MKQKKLIRSIEAVVLTAVLTFTTVSATTPVYADITEELTQEAEASAEAETEPDETEDPAIGESVYESEEPAIEEPIDDVQPDDAFMEENDEEDLSAEVAQEPPVTSGKVLRLASAGTGIQTGQHIFYGEQNGAITGYSYALPTSLFGDGDERFLHYWRVLDPKKGNYGGNNMLVISEALWSGSDGQGIMFDAGTEAQNYEDRSNDWLNSDAEHWCFGLCQSNLFDDIERSSITKFVKDDPTNDSYGACRLTTYDQIFFLSADEAQTYFPEINGASAGERYKTYFGDDVKSWWLRTPESGGTDKAFYVGDSDTPRADDVREMHYARPAFNIKLDSILFSSAAVGAKPVMSGDGVLSAVKSDNISDWKLTVKDTSYNFAAAIDNKDSVTASAGEKLKVTYFMAREGYTVSAIICDDDTKEILYYGKLKETNDAGYSGGTTSLTIPSDILPGTYTMYVFSEKCNGDYKTDYASNLVDITLTIPSCKVTFNANGHGTAPAAVTLAKGLAVEKPADLSADGWIFGGWYTDAACTSPYDFSSPVSGDITLFAGWKEKEAPAEDGIGTFSSDGKMLRDEDGREYHVADKIEPDKLKKKDLVADEKTGGKYKITSVTVKKGKVTGGTVVFLKPYDAAAKTVVIKDTVTIGGLKFKITEIAAKAFFKNKNLTKITIGKNVKKIGANAFSGASKLKTINIKTTKLKKKTVGTNAFKDIHKKAKAKVPGKKLKSYKTILKLRGMKGKNQSIRK